MTAPAPAIAPAAARLPTPPKPVELPAHPRLSRLYRLQFEPVQTAWVLLYPEGMVKLNASAAEILRLCTGQLGTDEIVAGIELLFQQKNLAPQVHSLLQEGMRRGWIV